MTKAYIWMILTTQALSIVSILVRLGYGKYPRQSTETAGEAVWILVLCAAMFAWGVVLLVRM